MNVLRPILPNGAELPEDTTSNAIHVSRDASASTYIHHASTLDNGESISCIRTKGSTRNPQFEDYEPFVSSSHFLAYDLGISRRISCPDCKELVDPCLLQTHLQTDCIKKQKIETECELCGRHMLLTNLKRHMETHGQERYMCSSCGRKFHRSDYFRKHTTNPRACQLYLSELSMRITSEKNQDEIDLDNPVFHTTLTGLRKHFETVKLAHHEYRILCPPGITLIDLELSALISSSRGIHGKRDHLDDWRCQVHGCTFGVRNTMLFDLHMICRHINGGLKWYCRHPLCRGKSWAAQSGQSVREHEETYHSENTCEGYNFCQLRHPKSVEEHWSQGRKLRMYYDAMPWVNQKTGEAVHPKFIKTISSDALSRSVLGKFPCDIQSCEEAYTTKRNMVIHQLTTHFNCLMACPIGCRATFASLETVQDHLQEAHKLCFPLIRDSSLTDSGAMDKFLDSHTFQMSELARRVNDALKASPNTVFFIDVETSVSFMGQSAESIEISIIDGNHDVIIDTLVDHGLTINQMFNLYAAPPTKDFRYRTLAKVLGPPSNKGVPGRSPEQIIQILKAAGMNKNSFLVEWSMSSYDWHALKRLVSKAGGSDTEFLPLYANSWRLLQEWKHNMPGVSCSLDKLFPLIFPNDKLVGLNHRSLPDTKMLMKLTQKFFGMAIKL